MPSEPIATPAEVFVEDGHVILDGRDGLALTFTPAAARETAARMDVAATLAALHQGFALEPPVIRARN